MSYCTPADLQLAMPARTLTELSNDDPAAAAPDMAVVAEAIRSAEELVDVHLRGRYTLPLAPVPTAVRDWTVSLARHWLYARRPEGNLPEAVTASYKATLKLLESARDGKLTLGDMATGQAQPEPAKAKVRVRPAVFSDELLGRF